MSARKGEDQRIELVDEVINYREFPRTRKCDKKINMVPATWKMKSLYDDREDTCSITKEKKLQEMGKIRISHNSAELSHSLCFSKQSHR